jgi:hypothetical protein
MLRGWETGEPFPGFSDSDSQGNTNKPETEPKMEILEFLFEFGVVTVVIAAVAALKFLRN